MTGFLTGGAHFGRLKIQVLILGIATLSLGVKTICVAMATTPSLAGFGIANDQ